MLAIPNSETVYRTLWAAVCAVLLLGAVACSGAGGAGGVSVVATAYPLAYFTQQVAGDTLKVQALIPAGVEPHDWEPSPKDLVTVQQAKLFVYNGAGLEPWAERVVGATGGKLLAVEASRGIATLAAADEDGEAGADPHVWLDPALAQTMVDRIADGLAQANAGAAATYKANADKLNQRLALLDQQYQAGLASCRLKTFIAAHDAFGYPAKRYGLQQLAIAGMSPEAAPSASHLASLAGAARSTGAKYVFFETLTSPALAQTLAREVGLQTLVLNPIEGFSADDQQAGKDYFTAMADNLANLRRALECS